MSQSTLAAAGHGTVVPAPGNLRAVVNDDDSIDTSWDAVPGPGVTYTLKETESPDGVHDAIRITETHSHRTPHTPRVYEYWVVAVRDGVESADSEHVRVTFPQSTTPPEEGEEGAQSNASPADILKIGGVGVGGHWELGVGARVQDQPTLFDAALDGEKPDENKILTLTERGLRRGFAHAPYFMPTADGTAVHFQAFMTGAVKPSKGDGHGSDYTRTELRELDANGKTFTWDASKGRHRLSGTTAVLALPQFKRQICVAQIHGDPSDTLELRVEGEDGTQTDGLEWVVEFSVGGKVRKSVKNSYALGDEVDWEINVEEKTVTVTIDQVVQFTQPLSLKGRYFKTGCYTQSTVKPKGHHDGQNKPDDFEAITLRNLRLSHDE